METINYSSIMLSRKERHILRQIMKRKKVPYSFCTDEQRNAFLKYNLISVLHPYKRTASGRGGRSPGSGESFILINDNAIRYFLYRKEASFVGKLPVIISIIALLKACDQEILWFFHFISGLLTNI